MANHSLAQKWQKASQPYGLQDFWQFQQQSMKNALHLSLGFVSTLSSNLLPPPKRKVVLPAGEIFIAIQKTCSSIKCVPGVVYSRTLQKQTGSEHKYEHMHDIVRTCLKRNIFILFPDALNFTGHFYSRKLHVACLKV